MVLYHEASVGGCSASRCGWNIAISTVVTRATIMTTTVTGITVVVYHLFAAKEALVLLEGGILIFLDL